MTDLGFGIADRRSVIAILFTVLLTCAIFGFPFPIDTSNVTKLFIGLSILTGFIYLARTTCRFLLIVFYFIIRLPFDLVMQTINEFRNRKLQRKPEQDSANKRNGIVALTSNILERTFITSYANAIVKQLLTKNWGWNSKVPDQWYVFMHEHNTHSVWRFDLFILGILDRLCIIGIGVFVCVPSFIHIRQITGYFGIGVLIVIYAITGHFSFVINDALKKSEEDDELIESNPITTKRSMYKDYGKPSV